MSPKSLELQSFRNLQSLTLPLSEDMNVLWGANGSGKTSVLEALHLLSHGRSFRSRHMDDAICWQHDFFRLSYREADRLQLRLLKPRGDLPRFERNGKQVRASSELAAHLPVQLVWSETVDMIGGAPAIRRSFIDRGCFFMNHRPLQSAYARYTTAMRQRNQLLRDQASDRQLSPWEAQMAQSGQIIMQARRTWMQAFETVLHEQLQALSHPWLSAVSQSLRLRLEPGWSEGEELSVALHNARQQDCRRGYSTCGPHRADMAILFGEHRAAIAVSSGQRKLLTCLLVVAQGQLSQQLSGKKPLYLFDDLASELDGEALAALCTLLRLRRCQCVVTAIRADELQRCWQGEASVNHIAQLAEVA